MSNPDQTDPAVAVAAIPLEYDRPAAGGWRPVIRLMSAAAVAQGAADVLTFMGQVAQVFAGNSGRFRLGSGAELFGLLVESGQAGVGVGLMVAGWLAFRNRASGRGLIAPLELAAAALIVTRAAAFAWRYQQFRFAPLQLLMMVLVSFLYAIAGLVLPALLWAFFRRPEVRASFADR